MMLLLVFFSYLAFATSSDPWTEKRANIIRDKLLFIWENAKPITMEFDGRYNGTFSDYLYDPGQRTYTRKMFSPGKGLPQFSEPTRLHSVGFTPSKALRLAFHDCIPYENGDKGCDGCLNLDENLEDNAGLQITVAVLEKLFDDKDFPLDLGISLDKSPKDLGMSRADLWAFTGLVSLAYYQKNTEKLCNDKNEHDKLMCDEETEDSPCFTPYPESIYSLFKTGRRDCQPRADADSKHGYRPAFKEVHPNLGFNGKMTIDYFKKHFKLNAREALALMGAHTVGNFNMINSKVDYAWVRKRKSKQSEVFNNKYYKVLSEKPAKLKETCLGNPFGNETLRGKAPMYWWLVTKVIDPVFKEEYKDFSHSWENPSQDSPGHLTWEARYERTPDCNDYADEDDKGNFFGQKHFDRCCAMDKMDETCLKQVQDKIRHLSTDVGFYFHWDLEDGIPKGCEIFETKNLKTKEDFRKTTKTPMGPAFCPKQEIKDDKGMKLYQRVERYAENQREWLKDFFAVFDKLQQRVDEPWKLKPGPNSFWNISEDMSCCLETGLKWESHSSEKLYYVSTSENIKNAWECQEFCRNPSERQLKIMDGKPCKLFMFSPEGKCILKTEWTNKKIALGGETNIIGKPKCGNGENFCQIMQKEWYNNLLPDLS